LTRFTLSPGRETALRRVLDVMVVLAATMTLVTFALGRFEIGLPGIRLRVSHAWRPAMFLAVIGAAWWWARRRSAWSHVLTRLGLISLLAAWTFTCIYIGDRACGGLDSAGYVGASSLLASGRLKEDQPILSLLPFPEAPQAAAPLGFVVGGDGRSRVPRFPLGLPLVMAAFRAIGPAGPFWVPIVMALGTLVLTYRLGRSDADADSVSGLFAASVLAVSPTFVNGAIQPMSDVPATFWIVAAVSLSLMRTCHPIGAGLAMGMAVLTRPALLPAALTIAGLLAWRCRHVWLPRAGTDAAAVLRRGSATMPSGASRASLAAGMSVFGLVLLGQAALNASLYGSAMGSGYGSPASLLDPARIAGNLASYTIWITRTHTLAFWIVFGAALAVLSGRRWPVRFSLVAAAAAAPYLFYLTWNDWESIRFVLPGLALTLVVSARGVDVALARHVQRLRPLLLLAIALACAAASHQFLSSRQVFDLWRGESKYPRVGQWVRDETPAGAVIVSSLHSGSIHYYAGRETLRWDLVPAGMLAPSVASLAAQGRAVYVALDTPSEGDPFAARFREDLVHLSMIPLARVDEVLLYELRRREFAGR